MFYLAPTLLFLFFDSTIPSLAVGLKTQGAAALPTRTGGIRGVKRGKGKPQWYSVLGVSLFNICLSILLQAAVELLFTKVLIIPSALKITTTLPMPWSIAKDVVRGLVLREVSLHDIPIHITLTKYRFCNIIYIASYSTRNHQISLASATELISMPSLHPTLSVRTTTTLHHTSSTELFPPTSLLSFSAPTCSPTFSSCP